MPMSHHMPPRTCLLRRLAPLVAIAALIAGCSHSDTTVPTLDASEQRAATEVTAHFNNSAGYNLDGPAAACVSARLVRALGTTASHQFAAGGAPSLTDRQATNAADAIARCIDLRALVGRTIAAGVALASPTIDCMTAKLTNGDLKTIIAAQLQGRSAATTPAYTKAATSMNTCLTDNDRQLLARTPTPTTSSVP